MQETSAIEILVRAFERLSSRVGEVIDLAVVPEFTFLDSIGSLVLRSVPSPVSKKVLQTAQEKDVPGFEWRGTTHDWTDARDFTIPLLQGSPSHQYLSSGPPNDDAIVEIAIMEPRPAWLSV